MPTITVRNVPPKVVQSLKALARRHNRSMEQEVRELLEGMWPSDAPCWTKSKLAGASKRGGPRPPRLMPGWVSGGRKAVIDTNVVAYLLLGTPSLADEARAALSIVTSPLAPAHWEAELTNVVWMAVRSGVLPPAEGPVRLSLARRLGSKPSRWAPCARALCSGPSPRASPYTTRCSSNWRHGTGCPLLTFDKALVKGSQTSRSAHVICPRVDLAGGR